MLTEKLVLKNPLLFIYGAVAIHCGTHSERRKRNLKTSEFGQVER